MDLPVLKSLCLEHEDLLLNDGCTGIAAFNPNIQTEVQFEEHKLLIIYAMDLSPFEQILRKHNIHHLPDMRFVMETPHIHSSDDEYALKFQQLQAEVTGSTPTLQKPTGFNLDQIFNASDTDDDLDNDNDKNEHNPDQNPKWYNHDDDDGLDWTPSA